MKRINNGAIIVGLSLRPYWTPDDGIQRDNNDIYVGPGKLKLSLSDNQPWRKSDFCGMGKGDVITLMPFLGARLTLEIL